MATANPYERMTNEEIDAQVETLKKMGFTPTQKQIGLVREGKRAFYSPEQLQGLQGGAKTAPVEETGASSVAEGLVPPRQFDSPYVKESELGAGGVRRGLTVQQVPEDVELNRLRVEEKYAKLDQERRDELNRRLEESTAKGLKENEEFEKAKVRDKRIRDIQEIEAKLKEFQSPTGYNMPGTDKEAVPGTGIYKTPEGGYSNRGVTGITRALTSSQKAEVANLEDRRRELEALQGGKAYTPRAKAELGPTDKLQKAMLETEIKNIDSQITKAKSGELDTSSMESELTEMGVPPSEALGKVGSNSKVYPTAVKGLYIQIKTAKRNAMFHQLDVVYGAGGGEDITGLTAAPTVKTVAAPAAGGQGTPAPAKSEPEGVIWSWRNYAPQSKTTTQAEVPKQETGQNLTLGELGNKLIENGYSEDRARSVVSNMTNEWNEGKINTPEDFKKELKRWGVAIQWTDQELAKILRSGLSSGWSALDKVGDAILNIPLPGTSGLRR